MNASLRKTMTTALSIALAMLITLCSLPAKADTFPEATDGRSQTVRVLLSRLGITDRIDVVLSNGYGARLENGGELHFAGGSELAVKLINDQLYLYYQGMSVSAGRSVTLVRDPVEDGTEYGFRRVNFPALYAGDLLLSVEDGRIRPVLSIDVEDYLLGVVPYEMSNAFPPEALKAQAIASRTYALCKQNASAAYDVVDTTNDQAYKGYEVGNTVVEKAVADTRGVCGFFGKSIAMCYYSASNGGQTERVATVWPTNTNYDYYAFGADKYDVENPSSTVRSLVIPKSYVSGELAPYGLRKLLAAQLADKLSALGYDPAPESIRVDKVTAVTVDTPSGTAESKLVTMFHITLQLSGRTKQGGAPAQAAAPAVTAAPTPHDPDGEVSLFAVVAPSPAPQPVPEAAASEPVYGEYTPLPEAVTVDAPIFPEVESAFGMSISSNYENEIWSVREASDAYTVESRRYGHGVGMSQRGAEWMAGRYDMTYREILAFYYPGMELRQYNENVIVSLKGDEALMSTAGPAPSPTPRPTLMPSTMQAQDGQWFAQVTGVDDDSTLNLRSAPDLGGDIVMRLYKYQRLLVLERCPEEGWVKVRTDVAEGYVVEKYLTAE